MRRGPSEGEKHGGALLGSAAPAACRIRGIFELVRVILYPVCNILSHP
jgi:hypothetical protein